MLEYDRIDISERIDINKTNKSKECDICHYWYFLDKNFNYEKYLCNGCDDAINFNDVAIVSIKGNDYRIKFWYMSRNDAIVLKTNSNLKDKNGILYNFFHHIQNICETTYYQRNREVVLNRAKDYYENNKELLREREQKINTENYLKRKKL